jgi:hypothetical protein
MIINNDRFWRKPDVGQDKKRSKSKGGRAKQAAPAAWRLSIVFSTAAHGLINMAATVLTPGSVLLCLFAAKRWL